MSLITFACAAPVASWSPSVNPRYGGGYEQGIDIFQPRGFAGSDFYSYDHGSNNIRTLYWAMLPAADMATLLTFLGLVKGTVAFTFTDYDAMDYTASRILNFQSFPFEHVILTHYEVTLELEVA